MFVFDNFCSCNSFFSFSLFVRTTNLVVGECVWHWRGKLRFELPIFIESHANVVCLLPFCFRFVCHPFSVWLPFRCVADCELRGVQRAVHATRLAAARRADESPRSLRRDLARAISRHLEEDSLGTQFVWSVLCVAPWS